MPHVRIPRLTIGIPTYDRPERLVRAINSALAQQEPAVVLVADQTGKAADAVRPYLANPFVRYKKTDASCLWANWTAAAEACDTELFAWLQDDDIVEHYYSRRIALSFDAFPTAKLYLGRLHLEYASGLMNWWQSAGPMVGMRPDSPRLITSDLLIAASYFTSWTLSPGVAFRWDLEAIDAIRRCPLDTDLYNERIVLAEICRKADAIGDIAVIGRWMQHSGNESKRQIRAGMRGPQFHKLVEHIDTLLAERSDEWKSELKMWAINLGIGPVTHFLMEQEADDVSTPLYEEARAVLREIRDSYRDLEPPRSIKPEHATSRKARRAERAVRIANGTH